MGVADGEEEEDALAGYDEEGYRVQGGEFISSFWFRFLWYDANAGGLEHYRRRGPHPLKPARLVKTAKLPF